MCNYEDNVLRDYQRSKGDDNKAADEEGAGTGRKASKGGGDRKNGGGGENEEAKRGGERLALLSFCGVPPPLLPHPVFLCISMIKT